MRQPDCPLETNPKNTDILQKRLGRDLSLVRTVGVRVSGLSRLRTRFHPVRVGLKLFCVQSN